MTLTKTITRWGCYDCDAGATDLDNGKMDNQAERHTKTTKHPTWCRTRPLCTRCDEWRVGTHK